MSTIRGAVFLAFSHQPVLIVIRTRTPDDHSVASLTSSPLAPVVVLLPADGRAGQGGEGERSARGR